jgi:hypothetical protein
VRARAGVRICLSSDGEREEGDVCVIEWTRKVKEDEESLRKGAKKGPCNSAHDK